MAAQRTSDGIVLKCPAKTLLVITFSVLSGLACSLPVKAPPNTSPPPGQAIYNAGSDGAFLMRFAKIDDESLGFYPLTLPQSITVTPGRHRLKIYTEYKAASTAMGYTTISVSAAPDTAYRLRAGVAPAASKADAIVNFSLGNVNYKLWVEQYDAITASDQAGLR